MNITQARRIARACDQTDTLRLHEQGSLWMRHRLWPATTLLAEPDPPLASRGLTRLAAVDELNGAYGAALRRLDEALALDPTNDEARDLRASVAQSATEERDPWNTSVADALALFDTDEALRRLEGHDGVTACLWRAAVHGSKGDAAAALAAWQAAATCEETVSLRAADWYHLADDLFDEPAFWQALVDMSPRFARCMGVVHESLYDLMCKRHDELDDAFSATLGLMARFHLARSRGDDGAVTALAAEFPDWHEIQPEPA